MSYVGFFTTLNIPWMTADPVGAAYWTAIGAVFDTQADLLQQAVLARFPDYGPADALQYQGNDSQLVRGPLESTASFRNRLKKRWGQWQFGGTGVGLMTALWYAGFGDRMVAVQQNGVYHRINSSGIDDSLNSLASKDITGPLSGNPSIVTGPPNDVSLTVTTGGGLGVARYSVTVNGVVVATNQATSGSWTLLAGGNDACPYTYVRFLAGSLTLGWIYVIRQNGSIDYFGGASALLLQNSTPWWTFDADNSFTSRFALLVVDGGSAPFTHTAHATFDGTEDGTPAHPWPTALWNNELTAPVSNYAIMTGPPRWSAGTGAPIVMNIDSTTLTTTGVQVVPTAPGFIGTVDLLAYSGSNPFSEISDADLRRLRLVLKLWRPAKATPKGIYVLTQGKFIGWPVRSIGDTTYGTTIGPSAVMYYAPE